MVGVGMGWWPAAGALGPRLRLLSEANPALRLPSGPQLASLEAGCFLSLAVSVTVQFVVFLLARVYLDFADSVNPVFPPGERKALLLLGTRSKAWLDIQCLKKSPLVNGCVYIVEFPPR